MIAIISQPMVGKTEDEIRSDSAHAVKYLESLGYEVLDNIWKDISMDHDVSIPLLLLGKSLIRIASANLVFFLKGWEQARGCKIEHDACLAYGINIQYEE